MPKPTKLFFYETQADQFRDEDLLVSAPTEADARALVEKVRNGEV